MMKPTLGIKIHDLQPLPWPPSRCSNDGTSGVERRLRKLHPLRPSPTFQYTQTVRLSLNTPSRAAACQVRPNLINLRNPPNRNPLLYPPPPPPPRAAAATAKSLPLRNKMPHPPPPRNLLVGCKGYARLLLHS